MKKIILILAVVVSISVPAAAYASQSITEKENLIQKGLVAQEYKVNNHEYRQQLWLNSTEDIHSNEPQLWL